MSLNIVFVQPEIPPNTGNIARTCAATDTKLHLKRAGLDYWPYVDLEIHESLESFMEKYGHKRLWLATTRGGQIYTAASFEDEDFILFGRETKGLPADFISRHEDRAIRIPMSENTRSRSFNLANSANIILFEALRQLGFPGLK